MTTELLGLSFGLVAPPDADDVLERVADLAAFFRERGLVDIGPRAASTYKELAAYMREGSCDVAWLGPVAYAWLAEAVTPIGAIRREGATDYGSALVVRDDSRIRTLADLAAAGASKELRAGWVDPWSAAGYVVPRLELARRKIIPMSVFATETFHGSHRAALEALRRGDCDVSATYARAPVKAGEVQSSEGGWSQVPDLSVRVLATWGPIPNDVLAVRRNLAPKEYEVVRSAFRRACEDEAGRARLKAVFGGDDLRESLAEGHTALRLAYESGVASGLFD